MIKDTSFKARQDQTVNKMAKTGEADDTIDSWVSDQDSNDQQSQLSLEMKLRTPVCAKERWGRLKTTVTATDTAQKKKMRLDRGDSFLRKFSTRHQGADKVAPELVDLKDGNKFYRTRVRPCWPPVLYPGGSFMFYWLGLVTLALLYNLWTCIAREAFREIQNGYNVWYGLDGLCDLIYILDIFVQFRTGYLNQGLLVYESSKLSKNYMHSKCFVLDIVALIPLDFLQFYLGPHALLRFPRFLKVYRGLRFMQLYESRTQYPNLLRVLNLTHILFLGSHWFAAFYYLISEVENFSGGWSYPFPVGDFASVSRKYLVSLHWSTLTLTTIGDLPPPETNWQYVFVIVSYLIGLFIFATIVGQVGNVITNRNASRQEFERLLDGAKLYMQTYNVPRELQQRVQRWYDYVWLRGRLNCNDINSIGLLPDKLKTELALHVNLETLKKVTIFQKCRPEFLHDLMLKMKSYIFTPGDLICRRGEVARELFIIADGVVEIIGENGTVLTRMSTGDFFGEIGILNLDGGINRRTADVRSVGYSELFVLSRDDVLAALKDHPDAESIIRAYGQKRLRQIEQHREKMRSTPNSPIEKTYSSSYFNNNIPLPDGGNTPAKSYSLRSAALKRLYRVKFKKKGQVTNQEDHDVSRESEVFQHEAARMKELDTNESNLFDKPAMNFRRASTLNDIEEIPNSTENSPILTRTEMANANDNLENEDMSMSPSKSKLSELVLNIMNIKRSQYFQVDSTDTDPGNTQATISGNQKELQCDNFSSETACIENHQHLSERMPVDSDIPTDGSSHGTVASDAKQPIPRIFLTPASNYLFNTDETIEISDEPEKDDSSNLILFHIGDNNKSEFNKAENEPDSTISHYATPVDPMEYLENLKITLEKRLMALEASHSESISRLEVAVQKQQELMNQILSCVLTIQERQIKEETYRLI